MNKDQVKGRVEQAKGGVKEATGKMMDDRELEAEGKVDKTGGKAQATYGDAKEKAKDIVKGRELLPSGLRRRSPPDARRSGFDSPPARFAFRLALQRRSTASQSRCASVSALSGVSIACASAPRIVGSSAGSGPSRSAPSSRVAFARLSR